MGGFFTLETVLCPKCVTVRLCSYRASIATAIHIGPRVRWLDHFLSGGYACVRFRSIRKHIKGNIQREPNDNDKDTYAHYTNPSAFFRITSDLPSDQHPCITLCVSLSPNSPRFLRSDTSTALLDRNCDSQFLGCRSGHRSKRHIFKFRTYLIQNASPKAISTSIREDNTARTSTNSSTSTSFCLASPVSSST